MAEPTHTADPTDDVWIQRLGGAGPYTTDPATIDDSYWEHKLGTVAKIANTKPEELGPAGKAAWNAGWNLFDAAAFGYGRDAIAAARQEPGTVSALRQWDSPEAKAALERYHASRAALDHARDVWREANPGLDAATTLGGVAATAPFALAGGEAALGATVGRLGMRVAPGLTNFVSGNTPGLLRYPGLAIRGAAEGGASGAMTSKLGQGSVEEQALIGAVTGGVLNPLTRQIIKGLVPDTPRWATQLASDMGDLGVKVRAGQLPGSDLLTRLGGAVGQGEKNAAQRSQFTRAVSRTMGQDTDKLDAPTFIKAYSDLDTKFDRAAANVKIAGNDAQLLNGLSRIDGQAQQELALVEPAKYQVINGLVTNVQNEMAAASAGGGDISGETFRAMTRYGSTLSNYARSKDPNVRHFAGEILDELHGAMVRGSPGSAVRELTEAKSQFKNMLIAQEVADPTTGVVDPTKLVNHVDRKYGTVDPSRAGDIGTLAQGGSKFLTGEAHRPTHEMSGRGKAILGSLAGGGLAVAGSHLVEHGGEIIPHLLHNPMEIGLGAGLGGAGYAGVRLLGPAVRRGVNPIIPPAVLERNQ